VGDGEADAWLGAYATDFLVEAKAQGVAVPDEAMDKALNAMRQISRPDGWSSVSYRLEYPEWWGRTPDDSKKATERMRRRASAYALYVMAKAGRGDLARLRWWHDVQMKDEDQPLAKAQVAAGLALMGDQARARSAMRQAVRSLGWRDDATGTRARCATSPRSPPWRSRPARATSPASCRAAWRTWSRIPTP
jgi:uncharacterized protein YfaS (alpha-2-macroglobulin family)